MRRLVSDCSLIKKQTPFKMGTRRLQHALKETYNIEEHLVGDLDLTVGRDSQSCKTNSNIRVIVSATIKSFAAVVIP